jgi:hypothetical protein
MSRLTRALVVGAAVAALSLAPTAAVAQDHVHHPDAAAPASAQGWNDDAQATRVPPAELEVRRGAYGGSADPAEPAARATAPPRSDGPVGPGWFIAVPLGVLAALVAGLAVLAARFSRGGPPVRHAV